jgi:hypothetical protein
LTKYGMHIKFWFRNPTKEIMWENFRDDLDKTKLAQCRVECRLIQRLWMHFDLSNTRRVDSLIAVSVTRHQQLKHPCFVNSILNQPWNNFTVIYNVNDTTCWYIRKRNICLRYVYATAICGAGVVPRPASISASRAAVCSIRVYICLWHADSTISEQCSVVIWTDVMW